MTGVRDSIADELRSIARLEPVFDALAGAENVYVVGGVVRDLLLGKESFDVDLVVEGDAIAVVRDALVHVLDFEQQRGRLVVHPDFGTATLTWDDLSLDVVTARSETYEHPAALPQVQFGTLEDDLRRRDFTINAIAASLRADDFGRVIDPFGGRSDIDAKVIRVLHDGSFFDDPTRVFRAIRYENRFGFRMDEKTEALARKMLEDRLAGVWLSRARLKNELVALLSEQDVTHTFERLADLDAAAAFHAALAPDQAAVNLSDRAVALGRDLAPQVPAWRLRMEALLRNVPGDEIRGVLDELDIPRRDEQAISDAVANSSALREGLVDVTDPAEIASRVGARSVDTALIALAEGESPALRAWFTQLQSVRLEVTGSDLAELGLPESPRVGEVLEELRRRKLRGELAGRDEELAAARELISAE